jgi:hypothetical protein
MNIKEIIFGNSTDNKIKEAKAIYQIEEYEGKFWLTFNGALVCPTDMFITKPLAALDEIRKLYVERNTKGEKV